MTDEQADRIAGLLEDILEEVRGHRNEFLEFTGYNVFKISEMLDSITGPTGYNLGDINERLFEVTAALSSVESAIDLK